MYMYPGLEKESFVQTRIRMYEKQKIKSSMNLLPDKNSASQHVRRANYQTAIWLQCTKQNINYSPIDRDSGWIEEEGSIKPIWYTCTQFPPQIESESTTGAENEGKTVFSGT